MTQITAFTSANCRPVADKIAAALATIEEELGVKIKPGNIKYGAKNMEVRLSVQVTGEDGEIKPEDTPQGQAFRYNARLWGFDPSDLGRTFRFRGDIYTLTGANPRAPKYPLIAERMIDGKSYKFHPSSVKLTPRA